MYGSKSVGFVIIVLVKIPLIEEFEKKQANYHQFISDNSTFLFKFVEKLPKLLTFCNQYLQIEL